MNYLNGGGNMKLCANKSNRKNGIFLVSCSASAADSPSILLATTQQGISGLYSLSSLYQLVRFLYVIFL